MVDKQATLDALAQGGTAARDSYEQALAIINQQKQQAIQAALANSAQKGIESGAQSDIGGIVGAPYDWQTSTLRNQELSSGDYFKRLTGAANLYYDQTANLIPAIEAEIAAKLAAEGGGGGGSGGGGSGGGGGGGSEKPSDWQKALRADLGSTKELIALGLRGLAQSAGGDKKVPEFLRARQVAADEYGVPDYALESVVPTPKYFSQTSQFVSGALKNPKIGFARIKRLTAQAAQKAPNQGAARTSRAFILNQARAQGVTTSRQAAKNRARAAWQKAHPHKPLPRNLR